ncbi:hypothetical protein [Kribbella sp. NPDC051137]
MAVEVEVLRSDLLVHSRGDRGRTRTHEGLRRACDDARLVR